MVIGDLEPFAAAAGEARCVPLVADGLKVLRRILALYDASRDARGDDSGSGSGSTRGEQGGGRTTVDGGRGGNAAPSEGGRGSGHDPPTALVPAIFSVFGGETSARKYLERCTIDYIINDDQSEVGDEAQTPVGGTAAAGGSSSSLDRFMWDTLLDASVWGDSWDGNWPGLELGFEKVPC
ncbi:hypothetical protein VTK73DRAFT_4847 [Phialemonium thermophilum]|uniref:Uncharacterized protein n=1 Tax=Phialemonium thermophilum TaxID=223376 RepID=A0ABR3V5U4_9PEZI